MGFRCGIVGLPNVGKSTLFNALTETAAAQAANYPFCTIEPNVGQVAVPDPRLDKLAAIAGSAKKIETQLAFVDIAGLVRGASKGEGLGNQFLGNIREVRCDRPCAALLRGRRHACRRQGRSDRRCRDGRDRTDAVRSGEPRKARAQFRSRRASRATRNRRSPLRVLGQALDLLREGKPARLTKPKDEDEQRLFDQAQLLTAKPVLYVCNVDEGDAAHGNALSAKVFEKAKAEGAEAVVVSAAIEAEIVTLDPADRAEFLSDLGLKETGLARVIVAGYELLHLLTFFTAAPRKRAPGRPGGLQGPAGGRRDPQRFRARLHPRRDDRL
jgi:ribosome-binding ATPase YchF (GTP1/OBG family)